MNSQSRRILLLGASGQVGHELSKTLPVLGKVKAVDRNACDLSDEEAVAGLLASENPDVIVNAAAYTAVDKAESERGIAWRLNAELPAQLARFATKRDALLVDFSTDYIFNGTKPGPWTETDSPEPINYYGESKLAGLQAVAESGCRHLVFIVSWVYSPGGNNFPRTMLRLARERDVLSVVSDQVGAPTPADWIAKTTTLCIQQTLADGDKCGLYNLSPAGSTNWADFARETLQCALENGCKLSCSPDKVISITTAEYPTPAKRPANSVLDTTRLRSTFGVETPNWRMLFRRQGSIEW